MASALAQWMVATGRSTINFPLWWYGNGLNHAWRYATDNIKWQYRRLGVDVWLKNIFVPMYAQRDWQGRLISLLIRVVNIIARALALMVVVLWYYLLVLLWVILPLVIVINIILHTLAWVRL